MQNNLHSDDQQAAASNVQHKMISMMSEVALGEHPIYHMVDMLMQKVRVQHHLEENFDCGSAKDILCLFMKNIGTIMVSYPFCIRKNGCHCSHNYLA